MTRPVEDRAFVHGHDGWLERQPTDGDAWSTALRRRAQSRFLAVGMPRPSQEEWRHLPLQALTRTERPVLDGPGAFDPADLVHFAVPGLDALRVVLVDGFLAPELSDLGALPAGLEVEGLQEAMGRRRELLEPILGRDGEEGATALESLNAAWCQGGVVVLTRANTVLHRPLHLLLVSTAQARPAITHPRLVIRGERSSELMVIEDHVCMAGSAEFVNLAVDLSLAENAQLRHVKLVRTGSEHLHLSSTRAHQQRDSRLHSVTASLDGALVRHDVRARLQGSGAEITLDNLVVLDAAQIVDTHSWIHHESTNTRSRQHARNVVDGTARAVFAGRVVVAEGARGTDAQQSNANLLLSDDAQIDVLPQLEIYNDDVKASHGATLGQLDRDGLFYLRSRGIDEARAKGLLTFAFANTVVETIEPSAVREFLRLQVFEHLPQVNLSEELV